jgi:predicted dehydrogenase
MTAPRDVRIGVIGAGLMGRELAGVVGRWPTLAESGVRPRLTAVCDVSEGARDWFRRVGSVETFTDDYRRLLDNTAVDVLYIAVPHHLHESLYVDAIAAQVDFLGEKPFGIDPFAAGRITEALRGSSSFVRCSSELPFYPGAQRAIDVIRSGALGELIEARFSLLHSSDLDLEKPINWKRRTAMCGQIGVMGDLGMHVAHVPLRLGWNPESVYAELQDLVARRPDGRGGWAECDTIENAVLHTRARDGGHEFPLTLETKRIAPGESNTWSMRVLGMNGGVEFSTRSPQLLRVLRIDDGVQSWGERGIGSRSVFPTVTGAIFETGFADALLQMWAAFLEERDGELGERFGCATPAEALQSHLIFDAALRSSASGARVEVGSPSGELRRHVADDVAGVIGRP